MSDLRKFEPGMRGGLARRPVLAPSSGATVPPAGVRPTKELAERLVTRRGTFQKVAWSLTFVGFLLYMFVITSYEFEAGDVAVGMALLGLAFERRRLRFPPLLGLYLALFLWCALGVFTSPWSGVVWRSVQDFGKLGLIVLAAVNALRSRSQVRFFVVFWLGVYALYPTRGTYFNYFLIGATGRDGRAAWNYVFSNPNDLAALTLLMLGLCVGVLASDPQKWFRRAALVGVGMLSLLIFLTQSRGGILGLSVFGAFAMAGQRIRLRGIAVVAAAGISIWLFAPDSVWERLDSMVHHADTTELKGMNDSGSAEQRFEIWKTAAKIIGDYPVFGVGWGAYPRANAAYAPLGAGSNVELGARDTHSTYLNVLAESGVPGLVLFLGMVGTTLYGAERVRRKCKRELPTTARQLYFAEIALVSFLVAGVFGSYNKLSFLYIYFALIWAMSEACRDDQRALRQVARTGGVPAARTG